MGDSELWTGLYTVVRNVSAQDVQGTQAGYMVRKNEAAWHVLCIQRCFEWILLKSYRRWQDERYGRRQKQWVLVGSDCSSIVRFAALFLEAVVNKSCPVLSDVRPNCAREA